MNFTLCGSYDNGVILRVQVVSPEEFREVMSERGVKMGDEIFVLHFLNGLYI